MLNKNSFFWLDTFWGPKIKSVIVETLAIAVRYAHMTNKTWKPFCDDLSGHFYCCDTKCPGHVDSHADSMPLASFARNDGIPKGWDDRL